MSQDDIEDQIDARVERMIEHLDRLLALGQLSQKDYNEAMIELGRWAAAKRKVVLQ